MFPQRVSRRCLEDGCMDDPKNVCIHCDRNMCDFHCAAGGMYRNETPTGNKIGYLCMWCITPADKPVEVEQHNSGPIVVRDQSPFTLDFCLWLQKLMGDDGE
jgi:hypothetical protein